jgi:hypothetical protein
MCVWHVWQCSCSVATHLTELPKTNVRASTVAEKVEKPLTLQADHITSQRSKVMSQRSKVMSVTQHTLREVNNACKLAAVETSLHLQLHATQHHDAESRNAPDCSGNPLQHPHDSASYLSAVTNTSW